MKDKKILIELDEEELTKLIQNQPELFVGETMKAVIQKAIRKESEEKTGGRYNRESKYQNWGKNPGSVSINNEKVRLEIPRLRQKESGKTEEPELYKSMRKTVEVDKKFMSYLLNGISQRKYKKAARMMSDSFGLSQSTMSRLFNREAEKALREFDDRDLGNYEIVAILIDGKYFKKEQIVHAVGITSNGDKIMLGFIHTTTENSKSIGELLRNLIKRNLRFEEGILFISDGSKGISKAVNDVFGDKALIQRCQWHKRENVISYLSDHDKDIYKGKIQRAYSEPGYEEARRKLYEIITELEKINRSAAKSMLEGLEETLTIHRLGLKEELGKSLSTTNIIENVNSQLSKKSKNVKRWRDSQMRSKWVAMMLLDIEPCLNRISNHKKLHLLRTAIKAELKIEQLKVA
ncbi:MAG: transposase [Bacteroidota bacterium]|jgi:transposase-like protein